MNLEAYLKSEFEKLNQKVDRINSMVMQLPVHHNTNLGDWLTENQTKELLQRGATSLWDLRKRRKIEYTKIGNRIYYNRNSILEFLEKNKAR